MRFKLYERIAILAFSSFVLLHTQAWAQESDKIKVTPVYGKVGSSALKKAYRYPSFQEGKVTFRNGNYTTSKFNYNVLTGNVEFINSRQDTLALDNLYLIASIAIGNEMFFYEPTDEVYLQLTEQHPSADLLRHEKYEVSNVRNKGAFGMESNTLPATNPGAYYDNGHLYELNSNLSMDMRVKTTFYLSDKKGGFVPATKRNILKLFPGQATAKYIKEHTVNFKEAEDLKNLLNFLDQQQAAN